MNPHRNPSEPSESGYNNKRRRQYQLTTSPVASLPNPTPPAPRTIARVGNPNRNTPPNLPNPPAKPHPANNSPAISPPPTIDAILTGQLSNETKRAYKSDLKHFLSYLGFSTICDDTAIIEALRQVNRIQATEYRDHMLQVEGFAAATVTRRMSNLGTLYDLLKEEGIIAKSPFYRVKRPRISRDGKTSAFTREQAESILAQPNPKTEMGRRDRILLLLLFFCGLRRGEIIRVSVEDFYENQGHMLLRIHGKGRSDKSDAVLVPPDIWPEIREYIDGREGPLFISRYRNQERQLSPSRVYLLFKKYCRQAGIDPTAFSPHSTRATYITLCLKGGAGLLQVAYAARHSDPATTIRYDRARMNLEKHASTFLKIQTSPSPSITDGDSTSNQ